MAPKDNGDSFTHSDKAELDALLEDKRAAKYVAEYEAKQAEARKRRIESVRGWASLVVLLLALGTQIGGLAVSAWETLKAWVSR